MQELILGLKESGLDDGTGLFPTGEGGCAATATIGTGAWNKKVVDIGGDPGPDWEDICWIASAQVKAQPPQQPAAPEQSP